MDKKLLKNAGQLISMGTQFAITIVIGAYLGIWIDEKLETKPIFALLLTLIFASIGLYQLVKQANKTANDRNN